MTEENRAHIAILGSVGVPANYGGFETLAEHLVRYHAAAGRPERLSVFCSGPAYSSHPRRFETADLIYSPFRANGASSVLYDASTLRQAIRQKVDIALMLGVSGAMVFPFLPRGRTKIVTHMDGLEWRRGKWSGPAKAILKRSEALAVRHSDAVIADHPAIAAHLWQGHGVTPEVIAYGGDHATQAPVGASALPEGLPDDYALALCRIVPENNPEMILQAFDACQSPLVFVGNWNDSRFGRKLRARFADRPHLRLLDPVHAPDLRYAIRRRARAYVHGHSAGGTNPALVEMMHLGLPILAFDCVFNRQTTRDAAAYFGDGADLARLLRGPSPEHAGARMQEIAQAHYRWDRIGAQYFTLFERLLRDR